MSDERWLPVVGFEGRYEVSDLGRVRRLSRDKRNRAGPHIALTPFRTEDGYLGVGLGMGPGRRPRNHLVHGLVARAFIGEPSPEQVINHKDFDTTNNCVQNLEWVTPAQNVAWSKAAGRLINFHASGTANPRAKLSEEDVAEIRRLRGQVSQAELGRRFGVSKTAIRYAQTGRNWSTLL